MIHPQARDLAQQQRSEVQRRHPARETVPAGFDTQGRTAGDDHVNRVMVHQRLDLRRPVGQVLGLVEEQVRGRPGVRRLVEARAEDPVLEPSGDRLDGLVKVFQAGDLVELDAEDSPGLDPPGLQEVLNDLLEERRLADLTGASQDNGGGEAGFQLSQKNAERPAAIGGKHPPGPGPPTRDWRCGGTRRDPGGGGPCRTDHGPDQAFPPPQEARSSRTFMGQVIASTDR